VETEVRKHSRLHKTTESMQVRITNH